MLEIIKSGVFLVLFCMWVIIRYVLKKEIVKINNNIINVKEYWKM